MCIYFFSLVVLNQKSAQPINKSFNTLRKSLDYLLSFVRLEEMYETNTRISRAFLTKDSYGTLWVSHLIISKVSFLTNNRLKIK